MHRQQISTQTHHTSHFLISSRMISTQVDTHRKDAALQAPSPQVISMQVDTHGDDATIHALVSNYIMYWNRRNFYKYIYLYIHTCVLKKTILYIHTYVSIRVIALHVMENMVYTHYVLIAI